MVLVALLGAGCNGIRIEFLPLVQIIKGYRHGVPLTSLVVAHCRNTALVHKTISAIHAVEKPRGVVTPMKQIGTGHLAPVVGSLAQLGVLVDLEYMIPSLPVDGAIRVEGHRGALGHHKMVTRTRRVAHNLLSLTASIFRRYIYNLRSGHG